MLLILTNSYDSTTDLLINRLPKFGVFRLNCDLIDSYKIEMSRSGFSIEDNVGRCIIDSQVSKFYYRKPWIDSIDQYSKPDGSDRFRNEELRYLPDFLIKKSSTTSAISSTSSTPRKNASGRKSPLIVAAVYDRC